MIRTFRTRPMIATSTDMRRNSVASGRERFSIISDGLPSQLPDIDPERNRRVGRVAGFGVIDEQAAAARPLHHAAGCWNAPASGRSASLPCAPPTTSTPSRPSASRGSPATRTSSGASAPTSGGTPRCMVSARQPPRARRRRPHRDLRLVGQRSTRSGFNHFFRGKDHGESGDQIFFQGHAVAGHLRPRVPRGPAHRAAPRRVPPGALAGAVRRCRRTRTRG